MCGNTCQTCLVASSNHYAPFAHDYTRAREAQFPKFESVLRPKSEIKSHRLERLHLYKIGFSKGSVEERIKNASQNPTYLMAPVSIVSAFKCYNINPQKMEKLLHHFFGSGCLDVDVFDRDGKRYKPREWFVAPLDVIEQAIHFVMNGEIVQFKYDVDRREIVGR